MRDSISQIFSGDAQNQEPLFNTLAENIKQPLLFIARQAELTRLTKDYDSGLTAIELAADSTLKLLDNYLLSLKLGQVNVNLEPVSVSDVLNCSAHQLSKFAKQYDCDLQLHLAGKYEPVMAHRSGLEAALTSLGYVFIEAQTNLDQTAKPILKLAAHRAHNGIVTGLFSSLENLGTDMYKKGRKAQSLTKQSFKTMASTQDAAIYVADSLLASMSSHLRLAKHQKLSGLAATLLPSRQMVLVK